METEKEIRCAWKDLAIAECAYIYTLRGIAEVNNVALSTDELPAKVLVEILARYINDSHERGRIASAVAADEAGKRYGKGEDFNRELFLADIEQIKRAAVKLDEAERSN